MQHNIPKCGLILSLYYVYNEKCRCLAETQEPYSVTDPSRDQLGLCELGTEKFSFTGSVMPFIRITQGLS
jgi:hypothetical protein